jgi:hypothetical protein
MLERALDVGTAWVGVLAGDIDDIEAHVILERSCQ